MFPYQELQICDSDKNRHLTNAALYSFDRAQQTVSCNSLLSSVGSEPGRLVNSYCLVQLSREPAIKIPPKQWTRLCTAPQEEAHLTLSQLTLSDTEELKKCSRKMSVRNSTLYCDKVLRYSSLFLPARNTVKLLIPQSRTNETPKRLPGFHRV